MPHFATATATAVPAVHQRIQQPAAQPIGKSRLVLIDAGPLFHGLERILMDATAEQLDDYLPLFWEWLRTCAWAPLIADHPDRPAQNLVLLCVDSPPYWRTTMFRSDYKGTRPPKSDLYRYIMASIPADYPVLAQPGYEADDVIALACREFRDRASTSTLKQAFILTVDHDLMGLITDEVTWLGATDLGTARVRNPQYAYEHLAANYPKKNKRRHKHWPMPSEADFKPTDIWSWKALITGDPSDNLKYDDKKPTPYEELSSLFLGLIDLHKPLVPIAPLTTWAGPALKAASDWQPIYDPDDLAAAAYKDTGLEFPIKPISMVPSDLVAAFHTG